MSNAWVTYLEVRDNSAKAGLIPDVVVFRMADRLKTGIFRDLSLHEGPASYQLDGEVTAHHGLYG